jgi:hypothetical protein
MSGGAYSYMHYCASDTLRRACSGEQVFLFELFSLFGCKGAGMRHCMRVVSTQDELSAAKSRVNARVALAWD